MTEDLFAKLDAEPNDRIYIRHGESRYNKKETNDLDSELTDEGVLQVRRVARWLKEHVPDLIYRGYFGVTTPYLRALQSARIIREITGLQFHVHSGPREVMTCYDQVDVPLRKFEFSDLDWSLCINEPWKFRRETTEQFDNRIRQYHADSLRIKRMVTVSHGTPIVALYELDQGIKNPPNVLQYPRNASVTRVVGGKLVCYDWLYEQS
jgi:broad specificity phosphatase PhoE